LAGWRLARRRLERRHLERQLAWQQLERQLARRLEWGLGQLLELLALERWALGLVGMAFG
jgi:hypothetical protein